MARGVGLGRMAAVIHSPCPGPHQRLVYSYEEAAEQLSISLRGLTQLIAAGDIKSIGYGEGRRRRGVTHQALVEWVAWREAEALALGPGTLTAASFEPSSS